MADEREAAKAKLMDQFAKLEASKRGLKGVRKQLHGRAKQQLDSMPAAQDACHKHVSQGKGDVLGVRRAATLATERDRLARIVEQ